MVVLYGCILLPFNEASNDENTFRIVCHTLSVGGVFLNREISKSDKGILFILKNFYLFIFVFVVEKIYLTEG